MHLLQLAAAALGLPSVAATNGTFSYLVAGSYQPPPAYIPRPIVDPVGELVCEDYSCGPGQCDTSPMRLCTAYSPCDPLKTCLHKSLFPMLIQDVVFFVTLFLIAIAAGAAGIGGGGLNVPCLMILNTFDIKEAVPLSHVAVMGNAVSQMLVNTRQFHPKHPARPLIHYQLALLLLPAQLGGNSLGVVVGRVFPSTVLVILSLGLLAFAAFKTFKKGYETRIQSLYKGGSGRPLLPLPGKKKESMQVPWAVIGMMIAFNVFFCADYLAMSKDVTGIVKCTGLYWLFFLGLYPFVVGSLWFGVKQLDALAVWHEGRGEHKVPGDPEVSHKTVILLPAIAAIIGLVAGLLGLGGGEFMVPLLLEFGLHPRIAAATSGFLIFFTTSSNLVHYLIAHTLEPFLGYAVACFLTACCGAFTGLMVRDTDYVAKKSYIVVLLLAFLLSLSACLLLYRLIVSDLDWGFRSFCV